MNMRRLPSVVTSGSNIDVPLALSASGSGGPVMRRPDASRRYQPNLGLADAIPKPMAPVSRAMVTPDVSSKVVVIRCGPARILRRSWFTSSFQSAMASPPPPVK